MIKKLAFTFSFLCVGLMAADAQQQTIVSQETVPQYLYKVLSMENWNASQSQPSLTLSSMDDQFIHCALPEQLENVIKKFWAHIPEFVVLKIETAKVVGTLVYEANNPGGNKYWHIYSGSIPVQAVVAVEIRKHTLVNGQ